MTFDKSLEKSALIATTLTAFTGQFAISSVNVALPAIQAEFSADAVLLSWVATSYLLAIAVFLVPFGKAADIYGRKKIFVWGLVLQTISSFLAAFSLSVKMLIAMRILQGFGSAMSVTTGMAILTSVFTPSKRGKAIGIYVSAVYIGLSVGPFASGFLTRYLGWRSVVAIVVPFGVVCLLVTIRYLKGEWADAREEKLDIGGSVLYGFSILALVYGASLLPRMLAVYLIIAGLAGLAVFIRFEMRVPYPVFEVRLFRQNRLFTFSSVAALINYSATFALTFLLSLYLQYVKNIAPQYAGSILIAQPVMMAVFSPLAGRLSDRIEPRLIASAGMMMTAVGLFTFVFIDADTSKVLIVVTLAFLGFGFSMFSSPNMNAIMSAVQRRYFGIASGTVATMRLLGQMASMAITMVVFTIYIGRKPISPSNYELFLESVRAAFLIFTSLCTIGILFSMLRGDVRSDG